MKVEILTSSRRARGPLHCPRCCWKLGRAESPAIAYLRTCGGCKRELAIVETADGGVSITVLEDPRDGEATFVALE